MLLRMRSVAVLAAAWIVVAARARADESNDDVGLIQTMVAAPVMTMEALPPASVKILKAKAHQDNAISKSDRTEAQEIQKALEVDFEAQEAEEAEDYIQEVVDFTEDKEKSLGSDAQGESHSRRNATKVFGVPPVQAARAEQRLIDAVVRGAKGALMRNWLPQDEWAQAANQANSAVVWEEIWKGVRGSVKEAKRYKYYNNRAWSLSGLLDFLKSTSGVDWIIVFFVIAMFLSQRWMCVKYPWAQKLFVGSGVGLMLWVAVGVIYAVLMFVIDGAENGVLWVNGYILEFIFSFENILIFHTIMEVFDLPKATNEKAIIVVIVGQIIFQTSFYMGLAEILQHCEALPYILGTWLLYVGYQATAPHEEHMDLMEIRPVRWFKALLGERLLLTKTHMDCASMFVTSGDKWCLSLGGLMTAFLLLADFMLEIDVTLTKIEMAESENSRTQYICFSSSVAAGVAVPALFFTARNLFDRYQGLKYGIALVLMFISVQMLFHRLFTINCVLNIVILLAMMLICAVVWEVLLKVCPKWCPCGCSGRPDSARSSKMNTSRFGSESDRDKIVEEEVSTKEPSSHSSAATSISMPSSK